MQGEIISPTLFVITINENEAFTTTIPSMGVFMEDLLISVLKYPDDPVLCLTISDGLQLDLHEIQMTKNY